MLMVFAPNDRSMAVACIQFDESIKRMCEFDACKQSRVGLIELFTTCNLIDDVDTQSAI
jgi:hypothetical protein